ncbi:hypothetical protein Tco_1464065 [Tanacetum coccineum]
MMSDSDGGDLSDVDDFDDLEMSMQQVQSEQQQQEEAEQGHHGHVSTGKEFCDKSIDSNFVRFAIDDGIPPEKQLFCNETSVNFVKGMFSKTSCK